MALSCGAEEGGETSLPSAFIYTTTKETVDSRFVEIHSQKGSRQTSDDERREFTQLSNV